MRKPVFDHSVERVVEMDEVRYECVECGLSGSLCAEFERYDCPPYDDRGRISRKSG